MAAFLFLKDTHEQTLSLHTIKNHSVKGDNALFKSGLFLILSFFAAAAAFPQPLDDEEEKICIEEYIKGNTKAKEKLIEHNLRLVAHIVKKYSATGQDSEDLISIGTIGLIKAISSFKPEKGARLATYAARCIEKAMLTYFIRNKNKVIRWSGR